MATIRTTHTGSLHRPIEVEAAVLAQVHEGAPAPPPELIKEGAAELVRRQVEIGIDVVNDGEVSKPSYATYVKDRLTGIEIGERAPMRTGRDADEHPDFVAIYDRIRGRAPAPFPVCTGPVAVRDTTAVQRDIDNLLAAAAAAGIGAERLFLSAASPGVITHFVEDHFYPSREEFLDALSAAMREEYRAIVEAGITLQIDCPDFAMSYNSLFKDHSIEEFRREVALGVEAVNAAIEGLAPESVRVHLCWGNLESPHTHDVPLTEIIDLVLGCHAQGISIEAANPRHAHEWQVFEDVALPDDRYLIPGVIDSTTNFVEHPELVAQRLDRYVEIVGPERVVAGTDCGFGTSVGRDKVVRSVAWEKLAAMVEGAEIASAHAARRAAR